MKKFLIAIVVLVVLLVGAVLVVPGLIPWDNYKGEIAEMARDATGREVKIDGPIKLSVLPRVELQVGRTSLANAEGAAEPNMVELAELRLALQVMPLISGRVAVDEFVLINPVIHLEIDKDGRPNWEFQGTAAAEKPAATSGATQPSAPSGDGGLGIADLQLGDVRIVDGHVSFRDAGSGQSQVFEKVNLTVKLPDLASPFSAEGGLNWNGQAVDLRLASGAPQALLAGEATSTELSLKAAPVALTFDGKAAVGAATKVTGNLKLDVPSVRELADWAGQPITMQGSGLGPLAISGQVDATPTNIAFRGAEIKLDGMTAKGELAANTAGKVPRLTGRLDFDKLDLNPYIGGEPAKSETGSAAGSGGSSSAPAPAAQPTDWSDEPIDASGLHAAEADLAISTGAILVNEIKVGRTALKVALAGGKLVADLNELNLYQGKGKGRFVIAALKQGVRIEEQFDLQSVQAEPLLKDAAAFDRLTGTANASFRLNASGASERALVSSLAGDGKVTFLDGAIRGINLAAMVRQTSLAALNQSVGGSSQTDFAELSGSFTATDGVVRNDDLLMKAPLLRLTGNGTVRMPPKTLNYRFEPKVVGTLEGQGGATQAGGLMVPVIAEGPWHDLKYRPDLEGLVKQGIAGGDTKKLLEGLVKPKAPATTGDTGAAAPAPKPKDVLKDALKGLFKSN